MQLSDLDAVILAGGLGTRLRSVLPEGTPKCMADISGTPFLAILADRLFRSGFNRLILATGYGHDRVMDMFTPLYTRMSRVEFSMETKPLGTAGAIRKAALLIKSDDFLVVNGDTFCDVDYEAILTYHEITNSIITVACDMEFRHIGTFVASKKLIDFIQLIDSGLCGGCGHKWEEHNIGNDYVRECLFCGDCYDYEFNRNGKVDMAEVFTLLGQRHEPVGWFMTDAPFYDIGDEARLKRFREYWSVRSLKGGEGRMIGHHKEPL